MFPIPPVLCVRIRNTSTGALRAAYLHGPYTLHVSAYPTTFNPNCKVGSLERDGAPEYEPQLKAGGSWDAKLVVPEHIRVMGEGESLRSSAQAETVSWIVEVTSQIIFSTSATVHYELLVGRDENALSLPFLASAGSAQRCPGQVEDHQRGKQHKHGHHVAQAKGVFSKAITLVVDDTTSLWNKPAWPPHADIEAGSGAIKLDDPGHQREEKPQEGTGQNDPNAETSPRKGDHRQLKPKRVHLVILTHGLHSNLSADLLYLKESIDAAAKDAREDARQQRAKRQSAKRLPSPQPIEEDLQAEDDGTTLGSISTPTQEVEDADDDEEVIVRGFAENVIRTERGIKYLGKRLAKYVLRMTYPQQPVLPVKRTGTMPFASLSKNQRESGHHNDHPAHAHSSLHEITPTGEKLPYKVTSISFIGHSLGGLVQTYAIAYVQKHSPRFFQIIKPINFVALATPFLGLSNENPLYVKFALDFGLVGRTGQDLGLAWSPPNIARTGWSAILGGLGAGAQKTKHKQHDPGSKPLLRILPTGPAHRTLRLFRKRTVYANVVNDGIVPLRTSCLLFLDWNSLERVEKARRENGIVGTMAEWGWAELTGTSATTHYEKSWSARLSSAGSDAPASAELGTQVPEPNEGTSRDEAPEIVRTDPEAQQFLSEQQSHRADVNEPHRGGFEPFGAINSLLNSLLPNRDQRSTHLVKDSKVYTRGQTIRTRSRSSMTESGQRPGDTEARSIDDSGDRRKFANSKSPKEREAHIPTPPRTSFFESAGAILNPPLPPTEFLVDPSSRPRTIFHDRVYHPHDIPPAPVKRQSNFVRSVPGLGERRDKRDHESDHGDSGTMTVEEKIARAYHRDMSWRKVLVRLEPDAHNNIIVRRMFANAYGWPVVKHLVDTHFSNRDVATVRDDDQPGTELAKEIDRAVSEHGEELTWEGTKQSSMNREDGEGRDRLGKMKGPMEGNSTSSSLSRPTILSRIDSVQWSEADWEVTDDEEEGDDRRGRPSSPSRRSTTSRYQAQHDRGKSGSSPLPSMVTNAITELPTLVGMTRSFEDNVEEGGGLIERVTELALSPSRQ